MKVWILERQKKKKKEWEDKCWCNTCCVVNQKRKEQAREPDSVVIVTFALVL